MDFKQIIRKHLLSLNPYSSARDEYSGIKGTFLDANENPFASVTGDSYNRYPDPYQWEAKVKIAKLKGVNPEQIFLGNGSDEAIDLLIKATCEPNEHNMLTMPPTYGMYQVCADIQQVYVQTAPLTEDFQINLDTVFDTVNTATRLIWICSPNNPSGNLLNKKAIIQILKGFPRKLVVIDEAYIDFSLEHSMVQELKSYDNLVILQTFSKAWGMAGLRIGLALGHPELIKILNKIKYPYNLNSLTQEALVRSLSFEAKKSQYVTDIIKLRKELTNELEQIPIVKKVHPSDSNMLLVKFHNASELFQSLIDQQIIVRDRQKILLCEKCLRITVGTPKENQTLLKGIQNFIEEKRTESQKH